MSTFSERVGKLAVTVGTTLVLTFGYILLYVVLPLGVLSALIRFVKWVSTH